MALRFWLMLRTNKPKEMGAVPNEQSLWEAFLKTGRVEDYLRYRGVDIYQSPAPIAKETAAYAVDDRRPDYSGKQQYR